MPPRPNSILPRLLLGLAVVAAVVGLALFVTDAGVTFQDVDLPRLVALLAILLFVGAGVFARPLGAWQVIRSMVVWAGIILLVTGLYASRDQLAGFAGRLLGALAPGVPITGSLAGGESPNDVAFIRSADGHFAVRAAIDDVPVVMLFDTGASFVTLTPRDAERVGIDPNTLAYVIPIRTANGMMSAASVTLHRLNIGPIERRNVSRWSRPRARCGRACSGSPSSTTCGAIRYRATG